MMKFKRVVYVVIALVLLAGMISIDAAAQNEYIANEPWGTAIVDSLEDGDVGSHVSIAYYEKGRAYISYYDATNKDLKLAHQVTPGTGNCGEKDDWKCEVIDSTGDVGKYSSIDVRTDYHKPFFPLTSEVSPNISLKVAYPNIGISYYDETKDALKYAEYACDDNSCEWIIETVEDDSGYIAAEVIGKASSFDFGTTGTPIIAYKYELFFIMPQESGVRRAYYKGDGTGNCGTDDNWICELIDYRESTSDYGAYISQDGGVIAYYDSMNMDLKYAVATGSIMHNSCLGQQYWDCRVVDDEDDVGRFVSLVNNGEDPMQLAYYDAENGKVKFAQRVTSGGNCGDGLDFACFNVDSVGKPIVPLGISLTLDADQQPIIAYMNASSELSATDLDIARPSFVYGEFIGNCGDPWPSPGMLFPYFTCKTIDGGYRDIVDEADYTGVAVSPGGLATIAYYERDSYYEEGRLKVAQQAFKIYLPIIIK